MLLFFLCAFESKHDMFVLCLKDLLKKKRGGGWVILNAKQDRNHYYHVSAHTHTLPMTLSLALHLEPWEACCVCLCMCVFRCIVYLITFKRRFHACICTICSRLIAEKIKKESVSLLFSYQPQMLGSLDVCDETMNTSEI